MKRLFLSLAIALSSTGVSAADTQCLSNQYDVYIDASLNWYEDLTDLTVSQQPNLQEVSLWFLEGRKNHFELNRAAVQHYLEKDPSKVKTERSVESWLQLEQADIKVLASRSDQLGQLASKTFSDRQSKPHAKNYDLRSAFADLLSHPVKIETALNRYNTAISQIDIAQCR